MLNYFLDKLVRIQVSIYGRAWSSFRVCGYIGLAWAIALTMSLVVYHNLSPLMMAEITVAALLTLYVVAMATKIITGQEKLIYYHQEIGVMAVIGLLLWLFGQPILAYLDLTILGIGMFLAWGRVGCLMVGCCHGRPHHWGVCYRADHAVAGFTPYFVGVRLFPVQLIESLWVLVVVLVGSILVFNNAPAGTALAWYVISYDIGRFFFEFMRGDPERPYYGHFSEAQWISLMLMLFVVGAELFGILPVYGWHIGATVFLMVTMIGVTLYRRSQKIPKYQLLHPHHVKEVANGIRRLSRQTKTNLNITQNSLDPADIPLEITSLGIRISTSRIEKETDIIDHYALSAQNGSMTEETARVLTDLILQLTPSVNSSEIVQGNQGSHHLLIHY